MEGVRETHRLSAFSSPAPLSRLSPLAPPCCPSNTPSRGASENPGRENRNSDLRASLLFSRAAVPRSLSLFSLFTLFSLALLCPPSPLHPLCARAASFTPSPSSSPPPSSCTELPACTTEAAALESLARRRAKEEEAKRAAGTHSSEGKREKQKEMEEEVKTAVERGWWKAARQIILESHLADVDIAYTVRKSVAEVRTHLDELIRILNKQHHEIQVVPPAFQWAQSPVEVFLNIKFAYRWSSPGALSVVDPLFASDTQSFAFSGVGTHSGIKKKYSLSLALFDEIIPEATRWSFASVGKVVVTLQKKKMGVWDRLTEDKAKISNMNVWWDMKEKVQRDLDDFQRGNYTSRYLATEGSNRQAAGEVNAEDAKEKSDSTHEEL